MSNRNFRKGKYQGMKRDKGGMDGKKKQRDGKGAVNGSEKHVSALDSGSLGHVEESGT